MTDLQIASYFIYAITLTSRLSYGFKWKYAPHFALATQLPWAVYAIWIGKAAQGILLLAICLSVVESYNIYLWRKKSAKV